MKITMELGELKKRLEQGGISIKEEVADSSTHGTRLVGSRGEIVIHYEKRNKVNVQGLYQDDVRSLLSDGPGSEVLPFQSRKVFVVYGHDRTSRDQLDAMLRRWKVEPIILEQLPSKGGTLLGKLLEAAKDDGIECGLVLATPDDLGRAKSDSVEDERYRARQNVVLELGLLIGLLGQNRVIVLRPQDSSLDRPMEPPSDIDGVVYIPFKDHIEDAARLLAKEFAELNISIDQRDL